MRTRRIGMVLAATIAVSAGAAAPAQAAPNPKCTARGAATLLATESARVFAARGVIYGCLLSGNRRFKLGTEGECDPGPELTDFRLAGRFVAYVATSCNIDEASAAVHVRDLRTGTRRVGSPPSGPIVAANSNTNVTDLEVTRRGSAVYIAEYDAEADRRIDSANDRREVRTLVAGGPDRGSPVFTSIDVVVNALALGTRRTAEGTPFYWRVGSSVMGGFVP